MECGKLATIESIWGDNRVYQCPEHAAGLQALGEAMGINTHPRFTLAIHPGDMPLCNSEIGEENGNNKKK